MLWLIILPAIAFFALAFCYHWFVAVDTRPPDLSSCTRLEIRYPRSALNYFLPATALQRSILSPDEKQYIQSIEFFTVDDPGRLNAFAHEMSLGTYAGWLGFKKFFEARPVVVDCYRDDQHMMSLSILCSHNKIIAGHKSLFEYAKGPPDLEIIEPPEMQPFKLRYECALNMSRICASGALYHKKVTSYPQPIEWCEAAMRERTNTL